MASQERRSSRSRYPGTHEHEYEPGVFVHDCAHDSSATHSSLSADRRSSVVYVCVRAACVRAACVPHGSGKAQWYSPTQRPPGRGSYPARQ